MKKWFAGSFKKVALGVFSIFCVFEGSLLLFRGSGVDSRQARSLASSAMEFKDIPSDCLSKKSRDDSSLSYVFSYDADKAAVGKAEASTPWRGELFIFLKKECLKRIDQVAARSADRFFISGKSKPLFHYAPSEKRGFCGTSPTGSSCVYGDFGMDSENAPEPIWIKLDAATDLSGLSSMANLVLKNIRAKNIQELALPANYFLVFAPARNAGQNLFLHEFDGDRHIGTTALRYLYIASPAASQGVSTKQEAESLIQEAILSASRNWQSKRWKYRRSVFSPGNDRWTVEQFLSTSSGLLLEYWASFKKPPNPSSEKILQRFKALTDSPFAYDAEQTEKYGIFQLVQNYAEAVFRATDRVFRYGSSDEAILMAASYWWSMRALERTVGCDSRKNEPFASASALVLDQYAHQECRRQYTNRAFLALNQALFDNKRIDLSSSAWTLAVALGSRRERIDLYAKALRLLEEDFAAGKYPAETEINALANEARRTAEEIDGKQVLTWLGPQPATDADILAMRDFIGKIRSFFNELKSKAEGERWSRPENLIAIKNAWVGTQAGLRIEKWESRAPGDDGLVGEPALPELRKKLKESRGNLSSVYQSTQDYLSLHPELNGPICAEWLRWMAQHRVGAGPNPPSQPGKPQRSEAERFSCIDAALLWKNASRDGSYSPTPEKLEEQCLDDKHWLSCLTLHFLKNDEERKSRGAYWMDQLSFPSPLPLFQALNIEFRQRIESAISRRQTSVAKSLISAVPQIHRHLLQNAKNLMEQAVDYKTLAQCDADFSFAAESCPKKQREIAARWDEQMRIFNFPNAISGSGANWKENALSANLRYLAWMSIMGGEYLSKPMRSARGEGLYEDFSQDRGSITLQSFLDKTFPLFCGKNGDDGLSKSFDPKQRIASCAILQQLATMNPRYCEKDAYRGVPSQKRQEDPCHLGLDFQAYY